MKLNRRELITAGASTGACLGLGLGTSFADSGNLITRAIPRGNENLPVIGIGTNRWVASGTAAEIDALRSTLRTFNELGGRVIDTAPVYRTSEKALGVLIRELNIRDAFFLATKVDRAGTEEGIARMQDSLEKLGTEQMDLMQVHNMRDADNQLKTMFDWKDKGVLRYVGITTSRVDQFAEMERLMLAFPLDFIQVNYSLGEKQAAERVLPTAAERETAVLVNRPFGRGRLFKKVADVSLPGWAADFDCSSWAQFMLKYIVSHPAVTCAIPGMTKAKHVADNMGAGRGALPDVALRARQEALFASL
jgi:aryl-alcohol dehydrogenase-like predicted oxidoreductase